MSESVKHFASKTQAVGIGHPARSTLSLYLTFLLLSPSKPSLYHISPATHELWRMMAELSSPLR